MSAASGIAGRVRKGGTAVPFLGKWDLTKQTAKVQILTFESPSDSDGNVWQNVLRGSSSATGSASGVFDTGAGAPDGAAIGLSNGLFVQIDLLIDRNAPWGIFNVPVFIDQIQFGTEVKDQAATFSMQFTVNGVCGKTAAA